MQCTCSSTCTHEPLVRAGRKKSDKAKRSFELNGTYSAKHLRLRETEREKKPSLPQKENKKENRTQK